MPHEWRSPARWPGSHGVWRRAERERKRASIVGAFVDRASIDWSAAARHAGDSDERAFVEGLHGLQALHGRPSQPARERLADPRVWPIAIATALGVAQVVCVLTLWSLTFVLPADPASAVRLALAIAFAAAAFLLSAAAVRDDRAYLLLATFVLVATAFAQPLLGINAHGARIMMTPLFRGLHPEVFMPAALWELAIVFPSVHRFTAVDVFARRAAALAWMLSAGLCAVNLALAYVPGTLAIESLGRDHPSNLYWRVFAAVALPAIAVVLIRAHRAPRPERLKVLRFAGALAAGAGPFLLLGVARSIPPVDGWTRSLAGRTWMDPLVLVPLGALPVLTCIAILVDRPFASPQAMNGGAGVPAGVYGRLTSFIARRLRRRRLRDQVSASLDRLRLARGPRELAAVLDRELRVGTGAGTVTIVDPGALPPGTALAPLLAETAGPIDLSRGCEPFVLLPRRDREWLEAKRAAIIAAVRLRDSTIAAVVLVGEPRTGDGFDRTDRWLITMLVTAAAAAWPPSHEPAAPDDLADECSGCGLVMAAGQRACCPDAATRLASLPQQLGGKYRVIRRLGAGGMGVVYLGDDLTLGRAVALKTLPGLREGAVTRLRAEARIMAALDHPAIATIYGVEIWRSTPVLVLEYFPRGTLADVLARGTLPVDDALRLGIRLADALAHVHARGVLHRDVKPSNIGFTSDGSAKLLDFGLADAENCAAGTRGYLPPEALAGAAPGVSVDLWGLAVVIREACGASDRVASAFLKRALSRHPSDRYATSVEMAAELRCLLAP